MIKIITITKPTPRSTPILILQIKIIFSHPPEGINQYNIIRKTTIIILLKKYSKIIRVFNSYIKAIKAKMKTFKLPPKNLQFKKNPIHL